jgi:hypothetical protein
VSKFDWLQRGHGNVEQLTCLQDILGDRLVYIGRMPTAEVFAAANLAIGVSTYSSAIFIKAGMRIVGRPAGPVRAPVLDLTADQEATLAELVARAMSAPACPATPPMRSLQATGQCERAGVVPGTAPRRGALAKCNEQV